MSAAERLLEAARKIRADWADDEDGPYQSAPFFFAVADWLVATAVRCDLAAHHGNHSWRGSREALAVADAYLGDGS